MPAPALQLAALLDSLAEQRCSVRRPCRIGVVCRSAAAESEPALPGALRSVSAGGVRLDTARRFQAGEVLLVELPGGLLGRPLRIRVAYVLSSETGPDWVHGCRILGDGLSDDELRALAWRVLP